MIDPVFAVSAAINMVLSAGFTLYCWRLVSIFGLRTQVGRAWVQMVIAGAIMFVIAVLVFGQALGLAPSPPAWWREPLAAVARAWIFIAVVVIFRSWKNLGQNMLAKKGNG